MRCLSCLALLVGVILGLLFLAACVYFIAWLILG